MPASILCVDDETDSAEAIRMMLQFEGYIATVTDSVKRAMLLIEHNQYDAFILDIHMPDRSGLDLCRWIRATSEDIPIIIYSAGAYKSDIDEACLAGATRYLVKPDALDNILSAVQELTDQKRSNSPT